MASTHFKHREHSAGQYWWLVLCSGILFLGLGIWLLVASVSAYIYFTLLFSAGMTFAGVFEISFLISSYKRLKGWGWALAGGLMDFLLGVYLLNLPLLTIFLMPAIIGLWMLVRGLMAIGSSIALRIYGVSDWVWLLVAGAFIIVMSLVILMHPLFQKVNIVLWTSFVFLLSGLYRVLISLQLKQIQNNP